MTPNRNSLSPTSHTSGPPESPCGKKTSSIREKPPNWSIWAELKSRSDTFKYLAGILTPVGTTGTKHAISDHVSIIILLCTHIIRDEVHLSLSEILRLIPQTWREEKRLNYVEKQFVAALMLFVPDLLYSNTYHISSPCFSLPYPAISQVMPGWSLCWGGGRQTVFTESLSSAHFPRLAFSFTRAARQLTRNAENVTGSWHLCWS